MLKDALANLDNRFIYNFQTELGFSRAILFGAGGRGLSALQFLKERGVEVLYFVDNGEDKWGSEFCGLPVHAPEKILESPDVPVIVSSNYYEEIVNQLSQMGVTNYFYNFRGVSKNYRHDLIERNMAGIESVYASLADDQSRECYASVIKMFREGDEGYLRSCDYPIYEHPAVLPQPGDVIADVGAFDGDTAFVFDAMCGGDCHIFCFEPSSENYDALQQNIYLKDTQDRMTPIKMGLWDSMEELAFCQDAGEPASNSVGQGDSSIFAMELDRFAEQKKSAINFIKMDIEGAEPNALRGAAEVIKRDKPDLQICLYHSPEHLWEIPLFIHSLVPEYTFYIGHHGIIRTDTVLYATCRG
ncbi:FkbM family methyltransferase [Pseudodesulfovibrio sp.]|nr:FkbM family methyltransferase [Pseudodesulfovibrio sp.]